MTDHDAASETHAPASEFIVQGMAAARVDLLSQMLTLVRMRGELVFAAEMTSPWALGLEPGSAVFHVVSEGNLVVKIGNQAPIHASAGDLLMMPHGEGHVICDRPDTPAVSAIGLLEDQATIDRLVVRHGGDGSLTRIIVGQFRFETQSIPSIMAALPSIIHIRKSDHDTLGWLEGVAQFLLAEAQAPHPGASLMISRLIDVIVIRALRTWIQTSTIQGNGWIGALSDDRISRALKAIHDEPFRRWAVADLAAAAGMSRSSFAERFAALVGEPPLHYQTRWRLSLAMPMLQQGNQRVSDVARKIGYDSDAAFSRAFKEHFGYAPVEARRQGS
jgi:AraC-like DNA-binding protein